MSLDYKHPVDSDIRSEFRTTEADVRPEFRTPEADVVDKQALPMR